MKFVDRRSLTPKSLRVRSSKSVQNGRIYIERVNEPFLAAGGSGEQFRAGIERAVALARRLVSDGYRLP